MADDQNNQQANAQSSSAQPTGDQQPTVPDEVKLELEKYKSENEKLKKENADRRVSNKHLMDSIAKAIGIEDDKTKDGDELVKELKGLKDDLQKERLLNKFNTIAKKLDADKKSNLIYAVIKDQGQLSDLIDEAKIEEAIKRIIKDYPELKNSVVHKMGDSTTDSQENDTGKSVNQLIRQAAGYTS